MINHLAKSVLKLLIVLFLFGFLWFVTTSCDPTILLRIENHFNRTVTVLVNDDLQGSVPATSKETFNTASIPYRPDAPWAPTSGKYLIEAKTKQGEDVYSKEFTWQELDDMDWTIVIPATP